MTSQIVQDYDVTFFERREEDLFDICVEALSIDRTVKDTRCGQSMTAQRTEKGQCAPVTVRSKATKAFALCPPTTQGSHVGLDPGFVDENQSFRVKTPLKGSPAPPPSRNVLASLFKSEQRFF